MSVSGEKTGIWKYPVETCGKCVIMFSSEKMEVHCMEDNELLLAISNMMDVKLKAELKPLKEDLQSLKQDVRQIKQVQENLEEDVRQLKDGQEKLEREVLQLKEGQENLKREVSELKEGQENLKREVHQIKLCQENVILPRLNTIESCYLDTYKRYRDDAARMEAVYEDVELLKGVVAGHSEKFQKLACCTAG